MFGRKKATTADQYVSSLQELLAPAAPTLPTRITLVEDYEPRPCWVYGKRKALFHRWANTAHAQLPKGIDPEHVRYYQYRSTCAIVEYEDGTVDRVWPQDLQFADGGKFSEFEWLPREQEDERNGDNQN